MALPPTTDQKALQINLDAGKFGTFAEIGAGQEVARWFFHVGKASATVAKTISAYDMAVSDHLYGPTDHYVSRSRLEAMLTHEFDELRHDMEKRRERSAFFVFADTVTTHTDSNSNHHQAHGWMGVRFQRGAGEDPSEVIIHVALLDPDRVNQQETTGIAGVNLTYGAFYFSDNPTLLMTSLMDDLSRRRVEVDMIKFSGPAFAGVDNRLMSLELVEHGLTDAAMFTADGEVVQPSEILYGRPVLIERGNFRPVTNVTLDMIERAQQQLERDHVEGWDQPVVLMEMTLNNLVAERAADHSDFLDRVGLLGALAKIVMISNYTRFDRVTGYLRNATKNWIVMVMGVPTLRNIFEEKYYADLDGGILEGLGRLFQGRVKLLIYPTRESGDGEILTAESLQVPEKYSSLYSYLLQNGFVQSIQEFNAAELHVTPGAVLQRLQSADPSWEALVPAEAARIIKQQNLFARSTSPS
jgi:hypothetical protein